jgi:hypothetical protein
MHPCVRITNRVGYVTYRRFAWRFEAEEAAREERARHDVVDVQLMMEIAPEPLDEERPAPTAASRAA